MLLGAKGGIVGQPPLPTSQAEQSFPGQDSTGTSVAAAMSDGQAI